MSQTPSSTPRPILTNKTNVESSQNSQRDTPETLALLSPPADSKRPADRNWVLGARKRVRIDQEHRDDDESSDESESEHDAPIQSARRHNVFGIRDAFMTAGPSSWGRLATLPTRPILQAFVSSNRTDVYKCESMLSGGYTSPPYACAYSYGAKRGENSLLAVSTEEGSVHVLRTAKRDEWDAEPERSWLHIHRDGVFDVQWSPSDTMLATVSADKSASITELAPDPRILYRMRHHTNTLKCIAWDPVREDNVLCTGSRDGMICIWDLRVGDGDGEDSRVPVMVIPKAHETSRPHGGRKSKITAPPARGVTSLVFPEHDSNMLISSGSYDGTLRQWDIRYLDTKRHKTRQITSPKSVTTPVLTSSADPTTYNNTHRARGITSLVAGTGASAGLLFALSTDSRIHTYDSRTLAPLSGWTAGPATDPWSYAHEGMRTNSFYVRLAASPCGRWLASGGSVRGSVYLFDVTSSARARRCGGGDGRGRGVELQGQKGEVGAVDWAEGALATCADDATVRIWREDIETYRRCQEDPEEMKWGWSWSVGN